MESLRRQLIFGEGILATPTTTSVLAGYATAGILFLAYHTQPNATSSLITLEQREM